MLGFPCKQVAIWDSIFKVPQIKLQMKEPKPKPLHNIPPSSLRVASNKMCQSAALTKGNRSHHKIAARENKKGQGRM